MTLTGTRKPYVPFDTHLCTYNTSHLSSKHSSHPTCRSLSAEGRQGRGRTGTTYLVSRYTLLVMQCSELRLSLFPRGCLWTLEPPSFSWLGLSVSTLVQLWFVLVADDLPVGTMVYILQRHSSLPSDIHLTSHLSHPLRRGSSRARTNRNDASCQPHMLLVMQCLE